MRKTTIILALFCLNLPGFAEPMPASTFYRQQLDVLKSYKPAKESKSTFNSDFPGLTNKTQAVPISSEKRSGQISNDTADAQSSALLAIATPEDFARAALTLAPEARKQKQMLVAARYNLSQTQALELLLNQFSAFMSQSPTLTPLFKEHPFPGVSAIKSRIAESIGDEASARLDNFLAGLARQARITAYQIIAARKKLTLLDKTINLYNDLKTTSDSLYRNGKISFPELTMISIEAGRLETQKNQYQTMLKEQQEKALTLLDGKRPVLNFSGFLTSDFATLSWSNNLEFADHPGLSAEKIGLSRLEDSIALVQRMAFPEYTSTAQLPMKKGMSATASAGMPQVDSKIEFNRVFVEQIKARKQAQSETVTSTRLALQAQYTSDLESFQRNRKNLQIIRAQMLPELEKAFASVKSKYESGQASFQELVETEKRLLNLREKLIDSEFATLKAKADMLYDIGKIQF
ncbi:MAG: TolC family protein [Candidatus Riflebacteria bacterium]|nr:TolC family protein [Candidatus Riflebacteria bacterium]